LLYRPSDEVEPWLVEPVAKLIGAGSPDHDGSVISELLKEAIAPFGRVGNAVHSSFYQWYPDNILTGYDQQHLTEDLLVQVRVDTLAGRRSRTSQGFWVR
jgi:hypothetical protein